MIGSGSDAHGASFAGRRLAGIAAAGIAAGMALVASLIVREPALPAPRRSPTPPPQVSALPTLRLGFAAGEFAKLFADDASDADRGKAWVRCEFDDGDGAPRPAKAALRGFMSWHHTVTKPSLRVRPRERRPGEPEHQELTRPEDVLGLANALPDQLARSLGLLHAGTEPVRVFLDDRFAGVYQRSLRPGRELAHACGRPGGTFWKGDNIGERRHLDLWRDASTWRRFGDEEPLAQAALQDLLAALREPATPQSLARLWGALDREAAARVQALAVLTGSIHADRWHNQMLWFAPSRGRLEPLLWDANSFGIHAGPTVPVEVALHPLAERLLADPAFVHRRNEVLWDLLHGAGSAARLGAAADAWFRRIGPDLRADPEPGHICFGREWRFQTIDAAAIETHRAAFVAWVQAREQFLLRWFGGARVQVAPHEQRAGWSTVVVDGTVAVRVARRDGEPVHGEAGRAATLLLPGLSAAEHDRRQNVRDGGIGLAAPHALPAGLRYELDAPPAELTFANAFTGAAVEPGPAARRALPCRSVHPWTAPAPAATDEVVLGPGEVEWPALRVFAPGQRVRIRAGTTLWLHAGAGLVCRGDLCAEGTQAAPIRIVAKGPQPSGGLACANAGTVRLAHVAVHGAGPMTVGWQRFAAAVSLHGCTDVELRHVRIEESPAGGLALVESRVRAADCAVAAVRGNGVEIEQTELRWEGGVVANCRDAAIAAGAGSVVQVAAARMQFCRHGMLVTDGARALLQAGEVHGHWLGALASNGAMLCVHGTAFHHNSSADADADGGRLLLAGSGLRLGEAGALAAERVATLPPPFAEVAAPR